MTTTQQTSDLAEAISEACVEIANLDGTDNPVYQRLRKVQRILPEIERELREALEVVERLDYTRDAEIECTAPYAIGFVRQTLERVVSKLNKGNQDDDSNCGA